MHIVSFIGVAAVTMTGHGFFEPGTAAGRAYAAFKAFFVVILWRVAPPRARLANPVLVLRAARMQSH